MMFHELSASAMFLVPGKVVASTHLSQGLTSDPIELESIRGHTEPVQISIGLNKLAALTLDVNSKLVWDQEVHWLRAIRLADDCHSYNLQLRRLTSSSSPTRPSDGSQDVRQGHLVLEVVRPINVGDELLLWFSEDILVLLQIGFLTPANIQGQRNYVCTRCSALYEFPNPLKLHVALDCGRRSLTWFWEKMSQVLLDHCRSMAASSEFFFSLTQHAASNLTIKSDPLDLSSQVSSTKRCKEIHESDDDTTEKTDLFRKSAFTPFSKQTAVTSAPGAVPDLSSPQAESSCTLNDAILRYHLQIGHWPAFNLSPSGQSPAALNANYLRMKPRDDSQLETIMSSLGKYKEGHVCMYCGKTYSRKYGLKIHIRTHTGYKPLKCKYCLRPFGDPSNLNKHIRLHTEGDTPYKCELCGKILVRRRDLERHLKSRHDQPESPGDSDKRLDEYLSDDANLNLDSNETASVSISQDR